MDNFKTPGIQWGTTCSAVTLWKPSIFKIVITLPLNGAHQLEIGMTLAPEAGQSLINQV